MCLSRKDFRKLLFGLNLRFKACCLRNKKKLEFITLQLLISFIYILMCISLNSKQKADSLLFLLCVQVYNILL